MDCSRTAGLKGIKRAVLSSASTRISDREEDREEDKSLEVTDRQGSSLPKGRSIKMLENIIVGSDL